MSRLNEIRELTRVRVFTFIREPEAIFWVFVFPLVLAVVLGFAFRSKGVDPVRVAIVPGDGAAVVAGALSAAEHIEIAEHVDDREAAFEMLRKTKVDGVIEPGNPPRLSFDAGRTEADTARLRVQRALGLAIDGWQEAPLELSPITGTGSRYVDYLFPGLIGMNLMGTGMWGIGFAIADVRRRKFLRRLMVTPMRRSSFFLSFMLSRMVFLVMELAVLVGIACFILGVPFRGNLISFLLVSMLGAFTFAGLGILVASRVQTIQGASGLMNLVMIPMWLASGVFFSYERFPEWLHMPIKTLPLTGLNDALRAVMLDGDALFTQWPELAILAAWTVVSFAIALKIFRWE